MKLPPSNPTPTRTLIMFAREAAGLTQKQLAKMIGVHWQTISDIERGNTDPRLSTVEKIFKALGITHRIRVKPPSVK